MTPKIHQLIEAATGLGEGWEETNGPETGVGVERWFKHPMGLLAYVVDDQGHLKVEVSGVEFEDDDDFGDQFSEHY